MNVAWFYSFAGLGIDWDEPVVSQDDYGWRMGSTLRNFTLTEMRTFTSQCTSDGRIKSDGHFAIVVCGPLCQPLVRPCPGLSRTFVRGQRGLAPPSRENSSFALSLTFCSGAGRNHRGSVVPQFDFRFAFLVFFFPLPLNR